MSGLGVALVIWLVGSIPVALVVGFAIRRSDRGRRRHPSTSATRHAGRGAGRDDPTELDLAAIERREAARALAGRRDDVRSPRPAPTSDSGDGGSARLRR
jgi:hypothetical protein